MQALSFAMACIAQALSYRVIHFNNKKVKLFNWYKLNAEK